MLKLPSWIVVSCRCSDEDLNKFLFLYTYNYRWATEWPILGTQCGGQEHTSF